WRVPDTILPPRANSAACVGDWYYVPETSRQNCRKSLLARHRIGGDDCAAVLRGWEHENDSDDNHHGDGCQRADCRPLAPAQLLRALLQGLFGDPTIIKGRGSFARTTPKNAGVRCVFIQYLFGNIHSKEVVQHFTGFALRP